MAVKKEKIVKRGVIAQRYKYTISESQVVTIKGIGELENDDAPLHFRFPAKNVVIAEGITVIGHLVFCEHYNLHTIQIPNTVTKIDGSAFSRCHSLKSLSLPDSITELGKGVFAECHGLDKIVLPRNLKVLPLGTFSSCWNLEEVNLSNIERIEEHAFGRCRSLKQIELPATVKYVGREAFKDCESLETVVFTSNGCKIEDHVFEGCQALKKVVLPAGYAYRNLGNLWGRDYTSLVSDIVDFLPSSSPDAVFPLEAIKTFYKDYEDYGAEWQELVKAEKSLALNESTTIWGFATLTRVYDYGNNYNSRYTIRFEEYSETIEDSWYQCGSLKLFLWKEFLSKPVDQFDGLTNNYTRFIYKWQRKAPDLRYEKPNPEYTQACQLLGEEIMTPYYSLDKNSKIIRLEEPTEIVDTSDAFEGFIKLVGNERGMIGGVVEEMIKKYGPVKTCRVLGHLITTGDIQYDEWEIGEETYGVWNYKS